MRAVLETKGAFDLDRVFSKRDLKKNICSTAFLCNPCLTKTVQHITVGLFIP